MSLENCGFFQLLKDVTFRRILAFFKLLGWMTCDINHIRNDLCESHRVVLIMNMNIFEAYQFLDFSFSLTKK